MLIANFVPKMGFGSRPEHQVASFSPSRSQTPVWAREKCSGDALAAWLFGGSAFRSCWRRGRRLHLMRRRRRIDDLRARSVLFPRSGVSRSLWSLGTRLESPRRVPTNYSASFRRYSLSASVNQVLSGISFPSRVRTRYGWPVIKLFVAASRIKSSGVLISALKCSYLARTCVAASCGVWAWPLRMKVALEVSIRWRRKAIVCSSDSAAPAGTALQVANKTKRLSNQRCTFLNRGPKRGCASTVTKQQFLMDPIQNANLQSRWRLRHPSRSTGFHVTA
jgi:hypothetical protein